MVADRAPSSICQECRLCDGVKAPGKLEDELVYDVERITREVLRRVKYNAAPARTIPVGVSVRHVHLSREVLERLYGDGYELNKLRDLYQPGEFAAKEVVTLIGPKLRAIQSVRILGPPRDYTQVELARTDAIVLGLNPPVRASGNLKGSSPITLVGPEGSVSLDEGAIRANRHIHMSSKDATDFDVNPGDLVEVKVTGDKALTFENVLIRVNESYRLQLHLDTDDANAADIVCGTEVELLE